MHDYISELGLSPLPVEGGLWAQSHRDADSSGIYYLLQAPAFSALHRLDRAEVFLFHGGAPARMLLLHPDGSVTRPVLGVGAGERPQVFVPANTWQATETLGDYSLLGTVVVPPYTEDCVRFADPELADRYPSAAADIRRLARTR
ncbi:cupin domain-containing protein [Sciscionella sediminilitoris]|uniref:cupin domain-containing protein n=1 Tax=Sciscionella sediminilitoris TaxID=1445613 RepID=UPI0004DFA75A|nr:cupin domain-containing protein [Sciscionella sp. SE31]